VNTATVTLSANTSWYLYNFRAATIRRLRREGYRVICLAPRDTHSDKLAAELDCEWRPLAMDNQGSNPLNDLRLVLQFYRYYRALRPVAALHFTLKNNIYGTWAARLLSVPAINTVSGLGTAFIRPGLVSFVVRSLYRASQPFAQRIFCQNAHDLALLAESGLAPRERLALVPGSGVDLQRFHPALKTGHDGPFRFLYAGRMLTDKGLHELIAALDDINRDGVRCHLWLSGFAGAQNVSAVDERQLSAWGARADIDWLGPTDRMERVYAAVDCVVLPSYREGMPRSLLEAGAMGLPVVTTDVPGCRDIVTHGFNGLLCQARDRESLAQAMQAMLTMPEAQRCLLGENGRRRVEEQFADSLVVEATVQAIAAASASARVRQ